MLQDRYLHLLINYFQKIYTSMRKKFKTILSSDYNDIKLVEDMLNDGYKLITIVTPNNYPYASTKGFIYWFEDIYNIQPKDGNPYEEA